MKEVPEPKGVEFSNNIVLRNLRRRPLLFVGVPGITIALIGFVMGTISLHHLHAFGWTVLFQGIVASWLVMTGLMLMFFAILISRQNWND